MNDYKKLIGLIILTAIVLVAAMFVACLLHDAGLAETADGYYGWAMCQPDSYVIIREAPRKTGAEAGRMDCGDRFLTDGKVKNGYLHIVGAGTETGDGWIHSGFVVYSEPERVYERMEICGKARVACRKTIDGKRRAWAKPGSTVTVYWISDEWSVTNKGFIKTRWLEVP